MKFTEVTDEELDKLEFANSRERSGKNAYGELMEAVKAGKKVKVPLEGKMQIKNLKWGLSQAAKRAGIKLTIRVLADNSGVVASYTPEEPAAPAATDDTSAQAPASGTRPRK